MVMFGDDVLLGTFMEKALRLCSKFCVCECVWLGGEDRTWLYEGQSSIFSVMCMGLA